MTSTVLLSRLCLVSCVVSRKYFIERRCQQHTRSTVLLVVGLGVRQAGYHVVTSVTQGTRTSTHNTALDADEQPLLDISTHCLPPPTHDYKRIGQYNNHTPKQSNDEQDRQSKRTKGRRSVGASWRICTLAREHVSTALCAPTDVVVLMKTSLASFRAAIKEGCDAIESGALCCSCSDAQGRAANLVTV